MRRPQQRLPVPLIRTKRPPRPGQIQLIRFPFSTVGIANAFDDGFGDGIDYVYAGDVLQIPRRGGSGGGLVGPNGPDDISPGIHGRDEF